MSLLRCLNPTTQILQASAFCRHHEYIFALLCLLNVNMGALDMSAEGGDDDESDADHAYGLLHELATIYSQMDKDGNINITIITYHHHHHHHRYYYYYYHHHHHHHYHYHHHH